MKEDFIEFDTSKTVEQIAQALRSVDCRVERISYDDPLGMDNSSKAAIEVVMSGIPGFKDRLIGAIKNPWAVQVYVYDFEVNRHVEMIALGHGFWEKQIDMNRRSGATVLGNMAIANDYLDLKCSKRMRSRIVQLLV